MTITETIGVDHFSTIEVEERQVADQLALFVRIRDFGGKASVYLTPDQSEQLGKELIWLAVKARSR